MLPPHKQGSCRNPRGQPLIPHIDDGDDRAAAGWTLMHCVDRNKDRGIADRHRRNTADGCLDMPMPRHVGIVHHDLASAAQLAAAIGLAFHEAIDRRVPQGRRLAAAPANRVRRCGWTRRCRRGPARPSLPNDRCDSGHRHRTCCREVRSGPGSIRRRTSTRPPTNKGRDCGKSPRPRASPSRPAPPQCRAPSCRWTLPWSRELRRPVPVLGIAHHVPTRWSGAGSWSAHNERPPDLECRHSASPPSRRRRPSPPSPAGRYLRAEAPRSSRCREQGATSTARRFYRSGRIPSHAA